MKYVILIICALSPIFPLSAQFSAPVGIQRVRTDGAYYPHTESSSSAWPYVVTGAAVGGLLGGAGLAIYLNRSNTEFLGSPFAFAPIILACSVVGAGVGYLVSRGRD